MSVPYRHIACCVDDSEAAGRALSHATALRTAAGGRLSVLHVMPTPGLFVSMAAAIGGAPWHDVGLEEDAARLWLQELADQSGGEPVLLEGDPPRAACEWAAESGCDLLVVASHRGVIERTLVGSFAGHLTHHAPCPVLLVPPGAPAA